VRRYTVSSIFEGQMFTQKCNFLEAEDNKRDAEKWSMKTCLQREKLVRRLVRNYKKGKLGKPNSRNYVYTRVEEIKDHLESIIIGIEEELEVKKQELDVVQTQVINILRENLVLGLHHMDADDLKVSIIKAVSNADCRSLKSFTDFMKFGASVIAVD